MADSLRDFALTGVPRGGTTLACRLLGGAEDSIALFEPMPVERLPVEPDAAVAEIVAYFAQVRERITRERRAPSRLRDGEVPSNPYGDSAAGVARLWRAELGELVVDKPLTDDFRLVVKHNAAFLAVLPKLVARMPVLGVLRHPLAVLCSWHSVDLPVTQGRLPAGERLDPAFAHRLAGEPDVLARQLHILDWCFERMLRWLPPERLLRYEEIVADGGAALYAAAGVRGRAVALQERNTQPQCRRDQVAVLAEALSKHAGPAVDAYGRASIDALATTILNGGDDGGH